MWQLLEVPPPPRIDIEINDVTLARAQQLGEKITMHTDGSAKSGVQGEDTKAGW